MRVKLGFLIFSHANPMSDRLVHQKCLIVDSKHLLNRPNRFKSEEIFMSLPNKYKVRHPPAHLCMSGENRTKKK